MQFVPRDCESHAKMVTVTYAGMRDNKHRFRVSSLSRPGMTHIVHLAVSHKFNMLRSKSPREVLEEGFVRCWSSDEFFKYGGAAYNLTVLNAALYPFFIAPRTSDHNYICSHTLLAVLDLVCRLGSDVLQENFSRVMVFNEEEGRYE